MEASFRYCLTEVRGGALVRHGVQCLCGKRVFYELFHQIEERYAEDAAGSFWTVHQCRDLFGHKECLIDARKMYAKDVSPRERQIENLDAELVSTQAEKCKLETWLKNPAYAEHPYRRLIEGVRSSCDGKLSRIKNSLCDLAQAEGRSA